MNIQQIMKQAQQMQQKLQANQDKMKSTNFEGFAGGENVKVIMNGEYVLQNISINKDVVDPEDKELLEDLIKVAINDCVEKITKATNDSMSDATGGLNLKMPF